MPLIKHFINPFTIVLFVLAIISLVTDVVLAAPEDRDPSSVIIICVMVTISGLLRFIQETRSNNAAEKLNAMVHTTVTVERDGVEGAVSMSKKKTIVKHLHSMQNFGAMDVLCTDKTGTLTQDKVILELHLDIHGNEDVSK